MKRLIIVETTINASIEKIWKYWTEPEHIKNWNFASDDWYTAAAMNDLTVGGNFKFRMEAKDGSAGFDLEGTYTALKDFRKIEYVITDGRTVQVEFIKQADGYRIVETFEAENDNSPDLQKTGWQAILDNFKKYVTRNS